MSTVIEQKVVEMRFDNKNFEQNVAQSMSTLDKLKEALSKSTSVNAFDGLAKAANKVDLSGVSSSIQKVSENFSMLEQIAIGALRRIGESIEEHLVRGLKNVTFGNVISGWERFAQKTEATQTILSAIANDDQYGEDKLGYVEELLEKLAWFSDETSYNFTDMTDNISKFTAAGMNLDASTDAMMGIATWAAMSGQNASVASRAMYQLSQAMGKGQINLVDWKSIEVANMATKEVKQMLMDYAYMSKSSGLKLDELGYYVEKVTKAGVEKIRVDNGTFRETLTYGWLTADAFSDAMKEYASYSNALYDIINNDSNSSKGLYASELIRMLDKAQKKAEQTGQTIEDIMRADYQIEVGNSLEGVTELGIRAMKAAQQARTFQQAIDAVNDAASTKWATIFEKVIGNVEEATVFYTDLAEYLYDIFIEPLNAVIETLSEWKEKGGRDFLFGYEDEDGEKINGALQNIGEAITAIKKAIGTGIGEVFAAPTADQLVTLTERFKNFTERLIISEDTAKRVSNVFFRITSGIKSFGSALWNIAKAVGRVFKRIYEAAESVLGDSISHLFHSVTQFFYNFGTSVRKVFENVNISESATEKFKKILEAVKVVINAISGAFDKLSAKLADFVRGQHFQKVAEFLGGKFLDILLWLPSKIADVIVWIDKFIHTDSKFSGFVSGLGKVFTSIKDFIGGFVKAMLPAEGLPGLFDKIKTAFEGFIEKIKESKVFSWLADALTNAYNAVKKFFKESMNAEGGASAFETIRDALQKFGETVADVYNSVKDFINANIDFDKIGEVLSKAGNAIATAFGGAYEALKNFFSLFKKNKTTTSDVTKASNAVDNLNSPSAFDSMQKAKIGGEFDSDAARESLLEFVEKIPDLFDRAAKSANDLAEGIGKIGDKVEEVAGQVDTSSFLEKLTDIWDTISAFLSDLFTGGDSLSGLSQNGAEKSGIVKALERVLEFIRGLTISDVTDLLAAGGLALLGKGFASFAVGVKWFADEFGKGLKNLGKGVKQFGKAAKYEALGKFVLSLVGSFVIFLLGLAGAIYLLNGIVGDTNTEKSMAVITSALKIVSGFLALMVILVNIGDWKNNAAEAGKFAGIALMMKSLAVSIGIMCIAVALMTKWVSKLTTSELDSAKTVFFSMVGLIVVIGGVMALIAHAGKGGLAMIGTLAMILAVKLLIDTVKDLYADLESGGIGGDNLDKALQILVGLILIMSVLTKFAALGTGSVKAAVVMLLVSAIVSIMSQVAIKIAKVIKNVDDSDLQHAIVMIGALGLIVVLLADLAGIGKTTGGLIATAVLLASVAAVLIILDAVFLSVVKIVSSNPEVALESAIGIIATFGLMCLALGLLSTNAVGVVAASASLLIVSVTLVIMASVFEVVTNIVSTHPDQALQSAIGIISMLLAMTLALGLLSLVAGGAILASAALLVLSVTLVIMAAVFQTITDIVAKNPEAALKAAIGIIAMLVVAGGGLALLGLVAPLLLAGAAALLLLGVTLGLFVSIINSFGPALVTFTESMVQIATIISDNQEPIVGAIDTFWAAIQASIEGFFDTIHLVIQDVLTNLDEDIATIQENIHRFFQDLLGDGHEDIMTLIKNLDEDCTTILENIDGFLNKILDNIGGPEGLIAKIITQFKDNTILFITAGSDVVDALVQGIKSVVKSFKDGILWLITEGIDFLVSLAGTLIQGLIDLLNGAADIIRGKNKEFWDAVSNLAGAVCEAIGYAITAGLPSIAINIIKGLGKGLVDGIKDTASSIWGDIKTFGESVLDGIKGVLRINSPSEATEEMGMYLDQGLANGLLKYLAEPMQASSLLGDGILESLTGSFGDIESLFADGVSPTITPVMDLSEVQNGMTSMDSLFSEYDNYSLDSALNSSYSPFTDYTGELKVDNFQVLFDKFGSMEGKFDELLSKIGNLQVVLDSGEIVGGLIDPIDEALGTKAVYAGRAIG